MALVSHQRCAALNGGGPSAAAAVSGGVGSATKLANGCTTTAMALNGAAVTANGNGVGSSNANLLAAQSYYQGAIASPVQNVQPDRPIGYGAFGVVW